MHLLVLELLLRPTSGLGSCKPICHAVLTGRKLKANNALCIIYKVHSICLQIQADNVTFLFEKRFLRKECKEHSIVCISTLMIINKMLFIDAIDCLAIV